jgi:hypothetical protein
VTNQQKQPRRRIPTETRDYLTSRPASEVAIAAALLTSNDTSIRDIHDQIVSRTHTTSYENTRKSIQQVRDGHVQNGDIPDKTLHSVERVVAAFVPELFAEPGFPSYRVDPRERHIHHLRLLKSQAEAEMNGGAVHVADVAIDAIRDILDDDQ